LQAPKSCLRDRSNFCGCGAAIFGIRPLITAIRDGATECRRAPTPLVRSPDVRHGRRSDTPRNGKTAFLRAINQIETIRPAKLA
jgi:hypothetical protein